MATRIITGPEDCKSNHMSRCVAREGFRYRHNSSVLAFLDAVYDWAETHYSRGGDTIVECFDTDDVLRQFRTLNEVKAYCRLLSDREEDIRNA